MNLLMSRNGRFLLRSPSTLLANSVLNEMEDALNQGNMVPVNVFLNLRSKSLLHVFASIGTSFNLKVTYGTLGFVWFDMPVL